MFIVQISPKERRRKSKGKYFTRENSAAKRATSFGIKQSSQGDDRAGKKRKKCRKKK